MSARPLPPLSPPFFFNLSPDSQPEALLHRYFYSQGTQFIPGEMILYLTKAWRYLARLMSFEPFSPLKVLKSKQNLEFRTPDLYFDILSNFFHWYIELKGFGGWSRNQIWPCGGSSTQWVLFGWCFGKFALRESPSQQETFQKQWVAGHYPEGRRTEGKSWERGRLEKVLWVW